MLTTFAAAAAAIVVATLPGVAGKTKPPAPAVWYLFGGANDVAAVHNASVRRIDGVPSAAACETHSDAQGAVAFTWHDKTTGSYANACILRLDGIWAPVAMRGHTSGFKTSGARPEPPIPKPPAPPNPAPTPAPPLPPCSLNGEVNPEGRCVCDAGWMGVNCGQLDFLAAPPLAQQVAPNAATSVDNAAANSTWGMSVVGPDANSTYHGYMTEIANECLLGEYGIASQVVHMTAAHPLGPWVRRGVALKGFAHNPQAHLTKNGTVVLFHIGQDLPPGCLADCTGTGPSHAPKPRPSGCPSPSHGVSVATSPSPAGPFMRHDYILAAEGNPTNPSALLLDNGTIILTVRRNAATAMPLYASDVDHVAGPWARIADARVHSTPTGGDPARTSDQDPFIFKTRRGYHIFNNRAVSARGRGGGHAVSTYPGPTLGPKLCGCGHIFSADLRDWFYGENFAGVNGSAKDQCYIDFQGSGRTHLDARQRPFMFNDTASGRAYLYNGAASNVTMYLHSWTLVQEVATTGAVAGAARAGQPQLDHW